jgi:hypothetical protein
LPSGPHSRVTSSSNIAAITCKPVPTARASKPSFADSAISPIDTITCSGTAISAGITSGWARRGFFW